MAAGCNSRRRSEPETTQPILSEAKGGVIPQIDEAILTPGLQARRDMILGKNFVNFLF
jgi:hypothetical protein